MLPDQRERITRLLEEMEAEAGPIPVDMLDAARQLWGPDGDLAEGNEEVAE